MVQSITTFCEVTPDHSTKQMAMRPCGPERIASITLGFDNAAAYPSRWSWNLRVSTLRETSEASTRRRSTDSSARDGVTSARIEAANTSRRTKRVMPDLHEARIEFRTRQRRPLR